uniref:Sas10 C-terminal domain-containing protein n=1 Tax=Mucochytrium quahogii TaxID=96639 RepID=A0A7S2WK05_9STRA|mmetsp:Transcript_23808/g.37905  ORF Transcript_23808/g.37905 Transcript_23808/m.37905 type:complete len:584 (+) Transcript_23808:2405-4156(+)
MMARGRGSKGRGQGRKVADEDPVSEDEVEQFNAQRMGEDQVSSSEEEEDSDLDAEAVLDLKGGERWGNKRSDYFQQGEDESEDDQGEEDERAEEEEAKRLKKQLASSVEKKHFEIESDSSDEEEIEMKKKKKKKKSSKIGNADLEKVAAHAPELLGLLADFKKNLSTLEKHVAPVFEKVKDNELATEDGMTFLQAKAQAMLTYCINVAFYLYLRLEGQSVKDHPVIAQLVRVRTVLEKLKPLDLKLSSQIDRLLHQNDNVKRRPNASDLIADDDEEENEEDSDDSENAPKQKKGRGESKKYIVPKLAPLEDEDETDKRDKKRDKLQRKLKNNKLLQELRSEFSDRPVESVSIGASMQDSKNRELDAERKRYEEEYFVRLQETKKEKKERRQRERDAEQGITNSLAELEDFGDLEGLVQRVDRESSYRVNDKARRQQELDRFMKDQGLEMMSNKNTGIEEEDDDDEELEEDPMYEKAKMESQNKKRSRAEKYAFEEKMYPKQTPDQLKSTDKRYANYKILKNKGLTPHRKKDERNPRVKRRKKFEQKVKQRKGQVMEQRERSDVYTGESTGLRTNLVASRRPGK